MKTYHFVFIFLFSYSGFSKSEKIKKVIFLGDSLTQGYGVEKKESFPSLVKNQLEKDYKSLSLEVINAGASGSTTTGAKSRLLWQLKQSKKRKPDVLVLALGANDGLRVLSVKQMEANLSAVIDVALKEKIKVLLCGMKVPPNYGQDYSDNFYQVFKRLAHQKKVSFLPFLLEGVAAKKNSIKVMEFIQTKKVIKLWQLLFRNI